MDDQQARDQLAQQAFDQLCREEPLSGLALNDVRKWVDLIVPLTALPVAPEQRALTKTVEAIALAEAQNRHARGELYELTKSRLTTFVEGAVFAAALVSSPSVETVTPDRETNDCSNSKEETSRQHTIREVVDWFSSQNRFGVEFVDPQSLNEAREHFGVSS